MLHTPGKAYLVGAGPGDPELLTLKARRILENAEVVLYDYLVDSRILAWCSPQAEMIYVGKSGLTGHHLSQEETERLMIEACKAGKTVCRLKGGDPYLFGRGAEEGQHLAAEGVPFEVVPGITSALAAPAYGGIPVTHRDHASAVAIITGHEDPTKPESRLDWPALAQFPGTLVFLMGIKQLPQITAQLIEHGKSPQTPVGIVQWGTRPRQRTVTGTLDTIVSVVEAAGLLPPCVIVIGDVVTARPYLNWFETLPLFGRRIVITRARKQASDLRQQLEARGADVLEFPTIAIHPPENPDAVADAISRLPDYDWAVFTSPNGVEYAFEALHSKGLDARAFAHTRIAAIGPATADMLKRYGLQADLIPDTFVAEAIFEALNYALDGGFTGKRFLLPRADIARDDLVTALEAAGATVTQVPVYRTLMAEAGPDLDELISRLEAGTVDIITFSSSSTVTNFAARCRRPLQDNPHLLDQVKLASIGPITSATLREQFGRVDIEAKTYTIPGLIRAIEDFCADTPTRCEVPVGS